MSSFFMSADAYLRALTSYTDNPCVNTKVYLQHKTNDLVRSLAELEKDMEQRVTENVLKALSVQFETGDAIKEIDSLKHALDRLGE